MTDQQGEKEADMTVRQRLLRLYQWYVRGPDHAAKLRVLRAIESVLLAPGGDVFEVVGGLKMRLRRHDILEHELIRTGVYEPLTLEFLKSNLCDGDVGIFAGVNFGLHVMVASRAVGIDGRVIAVEPQPISLFRAARNFELNRLPDNITLVSGGLGAGREVVRMAEAPRENSGWASLVLRDPRTSTLHVQLTALPHLLRELGVERVDLMLLDVEGYELPVLEGMAGGPLPTILVLEAHPVVLAQTGERLERYVAAVENLGYSCQDLFGAPLTAGTPLPENNMVCVRPGHRPLVWPRRDAART